MVRSKQLILSHKLIEIIIKVKEAPRNLFVINHFNQSDKNVLKNKCLRTAIRILLYCIVFFKFTGRGEQGNNVMDVMTMNVITKNSHSFHGDTPWMAKEATKTGNNQIGVK